jgi:hypothetical protein
MKFHKGLKKNFNPLSLLAHKKRQNPCDRKGRQRK